MELTEMIQLKYVVAALFYSGLGMIILFISFLLWEIFTPKVVIWKELVEKQNIAVAIFLASIIYGIATIVASAIHG